MRTIWLIPVAAALAVLLAAQAPAPSRTRTDPWTPDLAVVLAVENRVQLPPGSAPVNKYLRVYAGETVEGRNILRGRYFLKKDPKNPPVRMVMSAQVFPPPNAPGCAVVDVVFDVTESRQVSTVCIGR